MGCRPSKQATSKVRAIENKEEPRCLCSPKKVRKNHKCSGSSSTGSKRLSGGSKKHSFSSGHKQRFTKSADMDFPAFSTTTAVYRKSASKTSKITLRLSCDGSTLEIEQCEYDLERSQSVSSSKPRPWSSAPNLTKLPDGKSRLFRDYLPMKHSTSGWSPSVVSSASRAGKIRVPVFINATEEQFNRGCVSPPSSRASHIETCSVHQGGASETKLGSPSSANKSEDTLVEKKYQKENPESTYQNIQTDSCKSTHPAMTCSDSLDNMLNQLDASLQQDKPSRSHTQTSTITPKPFHFSTGSAYTYSQHPGILPSCVAQNSSEDSFSSDYSSELEHIPVNVISSFMVPAPTSGHCVQTDSNHNPILNSADVECLFKSRHTPLSRKHNVMEPTAPHSHPPCQTSLMSYTTLYENNKSWDHPEFSNLVNCVTDDVYTHLSPHAKPAVHSKHVSPSLPSPDSIMTYVALGCPISNDSPSYSYINGDEPELFTSHLPILHTSHDETEDIVVKSFPGIPTINKDYIVSTRGCIEDSQQRDINQCNQRRQTTTADAHLYRGQSWAPPKPYMTLNCVGCSRDQVPLVSCLHMEQQCIEKDCRPQEVSVLNMIGPVISAPKPQENSLHQPLINPYSKHSDDKMHSSASNDSNDVSDSNNGSNKTFFFQSFRPDTSADYLRQDLIDSNSSLDCLHQSDTVCQNNSLYWNPHSSTSSDTISEFGSCHQNDGESTDRADYLVELLAHVCQPKQSFPCDLDYQQPRVSTSDTSCETKSVPKSDMSELKLSPFCCKSEGLAGDFNLDFHGDYVLTCLPGNQSSTWRHNKTPQERCNLSTGESITCPIEDKQTVTSPIEDKHTVTSPIEDKHTVTSPIEDRQNVTSPIEDRQTVTSPIEDKQTVTSRIEDKHTVTSPIEDKQTVTSPIEDRHQASGCGSQKNCNRFEISLPSSELIKSSQFNKNENPLKPSKKHGMSESGERSVGRQEQMLILKEDILCRNIAACCFWDTRVPMSPSQKEIQYLSSEDTNNVYELGGSINADSCAVSHLHTASPNCPPSTHIAGQPEDLTESRISINGPISGFQPPLPNSERRESLIDPVDTSHQKLEKMTVASLTSGRYLNGTKDLTAGPPLLARELNSCLGKGARELNSCLGKRDLNTSHCDGFTGQGELAPIVGDTERSRDCMGQGELAPIVGDTERSRDCMGQGELAPIVGDTERSRDCMGQGELAPIIGDTERSRFSARLLKSGCHERNEAVELDINSSYSKHSGAHESKDVRIEPRDTKERLDHLHGVSSHCSLSCHDMESPEGSVDLNQTPTGSSNLADGTNPPSHLDLRPTDGTNPPSHLDLRPTDGTNPPSHLDLRPTDGTNPPSHLDLRPTDLSASQRSLTASSRDLQSLYTTPAIQCHPSSINTPVSLCSRKRVSDTTCLHTAGLIIDLTMDKSHTGIKQTSEETRPVTRKNVRSLVRYFEKVPFCHNNDKQ